jgi:hypothetical protein
LFFSSSAALFAAVSKGSTFFMGLTSLATENEALQEETEHTIQKTCSRW